MSQTHQFFCVVATGLEAAVVSELQSIGLPAYPSEGGVYTRALDEDVERLTRLRTPTAIRWQLLNGKAVRSLSDFRTHLDAIDWSIFPQGSKAELKVSTKQSKLQRSDILEDKATRLFRAIWGASDLEQASIPIHIRLFENKLWVSVALHRGLLHHRGWRQQNVKTPIRENWAQCLRWIADHKEGEAILDPFCGSGTVLIEAGLQNQRQKLFTESPWIFAEWKVNWKASSFQVHDQTLRLLGADRDLPSVEKARKNANSTGVEVQIVHADVRTLQPSSFVDCPPTGLILCNPPYGIGSGKRTDAVYHWLGETWRTQFPTWRLYFISTDVHKARLVSKNTRLVASFSNAGIMVGLYEALRA